MSRKEKLSSKQSKKTSSSKKDQSWELPVRTALKDNEEEGSSIISESEEGSERG